MKTLIVGGGLSGLALAYALEQQERDYLLIEARDRFGGRMKTISQGDGTFDLGPAWFWPGQPRISALVDELGLEKFDQYADGSLTFEDEQGQVQRGRGFSSMEGSWRLKGSFGALINALVTRIPHHKRQLGAPVTQLTNTDAGITAQLGNGDSVIADKAVLALPPRIAAGLSFSPSLPENTIRAMQSIPTWMAGQAKAIAIYDSPFWREAGLSGDAMSRHGPMVEIHDASPNTGGPFALFGFIGVPPQNRQDEKLLRHHLLAQLVRLFGPDAAFPVALHVKDWAFDPFTSTEADLVPLSTHPHYALPPEMASLWGHTLLFGGTEVAPQFGGFIEGALEAAETMLAAL
ncbi:MAG TPA: amine oxidase [Octadecabacter sp.]|nr:amine oxidase [Octadecabacter sp.]